MPVSSVPVPEAPDNASPIEHASWLGRVRVAGMAFVACVFVACLTSTQARAIGDGMDLTCMPPTSNSAGPISESQQVAESIACRYRLYQPASSEQATATLDGLPVSAQIVPTTNAATPTSAVLFAIDVSNTNQTRLQHLHDLVDAGAPGHRFALASFGGELDVSAPFGSNAAQIKQAAAALQQVERPTELYRNALEATRLLARETTERKALFLFSDGLAEDRAYFHQDVVDAARGAGVVIYGIGYPRSLEESVALQSLRRLADETGGRFVAADASGDLPETFFDAPFDVLDNVGEVRIPRPDQGWPRGDNPRRLSLVLTTASGKSRATVELDMPAPAAASAPDGAKATGTPAGTFGALTGIDNERALLYGLIVAGLLAVLLGASAMWLRSRRATAPSTARPSGAGADTADPLKTGVDDTDLTAGDSDSASAPMPPGVGQRRDKNALPRSGAGKPRREAAAVASASPDRGTVPMPAKTASEPIPVEESAFLERMGEEGDTYPVLSSPLRIGRQSDNDLVLKDPSISRHHAVVERHGPGEYVVRDLGALNGVIVNGMRKPETVLKDGDLIELGDLAIKFGLELDEASQIAEPESVQETLVLQNSLSPGLQASGLSLASFGDPDDDENGFDFLDDDRDEVGRG